MFAGGVGVGAVVRVVGDVVRGRDRGQEEGDAGSSRSATVLARSSLKRPTSRAKGASVSALVFGITGRRTIATRGFAERASAMKVRAFSAVWAAFV